MSSAFSYIGYVKSIFQRIDIYVFLFILLFITKTAYSADHAVILQYHHVSSTSPAITSIAPEQFEAHLNLLSEQNYNVWSLEKVAKHFQDKIPLPDKTVVITFDDAYRSIFTEAMPRLKQRQWPFTVFVNTAAIETGHQNQMSWDELRVLMANGGEIANHTHTHDHLIRMHRDETQDEWRARVIEDISQADRLLQENLGVKTKMFAYPYGEYNKALLDIVKELGYVGFGQHSGPAGFDMPLERLPRFPMSGVYTSLSGMSEKLKTIPMPLQYDPDIEPVLQDNQNKPELILALEPGAYRTEGITCYASGQGRAQTTWLDKQKQVVKVVAAQSLSAGRSRYNCTIPVAVKTGTGEGLGNYETYFYWYSQPWIKRLDTGEWYKEY